MHKTFKLSIFCVGFNAVIVQAVLIRELAQVFCGTELLIGLGLAVWLLGGAAGTACFRVKSGSRALTWFLALLIASAVLFAGQVLLIRAFRVITGVPAGQLPGAGQLLVFSLAAIAPAALANGALFALALRLAAQDERAFPLVYRWDVWGGFAGGLLGGLLLIPNAPAFAIARSCGLMYLVAALFFSWRARRTAAAIISSICLLSFGLLAFFPVDDVSRKWLFPGQNVVATGVSKYSQLAVVKYSEQCSLYENGQLAAVWPDPVGAEERCLIPLSLVRRPARVLLVGGGFADLALLASSPGVRVTYCEIDRAAWRLFLPFIGEPAQRKIAQGSVNIEFSDFRSYINRYPGPKFDLVLVNLPDPYSAGVNRGYTREFFTSMGAILTDSGVVRLSVTSDENYLSPALRGLDGSILRTVADCFRRISLISGDRLTILASQANDLVVAPDSVMARLRRAGIAPSYLSAAYLGSRMLPDRDAFIGGQLRRESAPLNRDLRPVGYAYQLALSSLLQRQRLFSALFSRIVRMDWRILLLLALPFLVPLFRPRSAPPCAALVAGFAGMAAQMAALLAFQALHGYIYHLIALLSACYLAGLALGGSLPAGSDRAPAVALLGMAGTALLLVPLSAARSPAAWHVAAFGAVSVLTGVCGGWALASLVKHDPRRANTLYAFDLAGGALGGICFALWWLPAFGQRTALLATAGLVVPAIILILPLTSRDN